MEGFDSNYFNLTSEYTDQIEFKDINSVLQDEKLDSQKPRTSFDNKSVKTFEKIIEKVPEEIVSVFNEMIHQDSGLKSEAWAALERCKNNAKERLDLLERFAKRESPNQFLKDSFNQLNKLFLSDQFDSIYFASKEVELLSVFKFSFERSRNVIYFPLHPFDHAFLIFSLLNSSSKNVQTIISSNWFDGPLFMRMYHYASGAYPFVTESSKERYKNLKQIAEMQISKGGAILPLVDSIHVELFNRRVLENYMGNLDNHDSNIQLIFPENKDEYPFLELDYDPKDLQNNHVQLSDEFIKRVLFSLKSELDFDIKVLAMSLDQPRDSMDLYVYENILNKHEILKLYKKYLYHGDYAKRGFLTRENAVANRNNIFNAINKVLFKGYEESLRRIDEMREDPSKCRDLLFKDKDLANNGRQEVTVTQLVKDLCKCETVEEIRNAEAFTILKQLGVDMDAFVDFYPYES